MSSDEGSGSEVEEEPEEEVEEPQEEGCEEEAEEEPEKQEYEEEAVEGEGEPEEEVCDEEACEEEAYEEQEAEYEEAAEEYEEQRAEYEEAAEEYEEQRAEYEEAAEEYDDGSGDSSGSSSSSSDSEGSEDEENNGVSIEIKIKKKKKKKKKKKEKAKNEMAPVYYEETGAGDVAHYGGGAGYNEGGAGYNEGSTGYNEGGTGYNEGSTGYNEGGTGYNEGGTGYNEGGTGYNEGSTGYNEGSTGYNEGGTGYNDGGDDDDNYFETVLLRPADESYSPTVFPADPFSAEDDAAILRKAMKGLGTDEKAIIGVISQRTNDQRQEIMRTFKTMYGKDLIKNLKSELGGNLKKLAVSLFKTQGQFDAESLHEAMDGIGTKENVLIEVLCTRTNAEIHSLNEWYKKDYHKTLEDRIISETSGHFKRVLVSCCQGNRAEITPEEIAQLDDSGIPINVDMELAYNEAQEMYSAGKGKLGTDESVFLRILALRHQFQLRQTFISYVEISGRDIENTIKREMSGDEKAGFLALVLCAKNRQRFFAEQLHKAMSGLGTKDSTLIRIIVSRSEIDLQDIKDEYLNLYKKTLATDVSKETSGDYKKLLLAIIGE